MTDAFTNAVAQQLQQLFTTIQQGTDRTGRALDGGVSSSGTPLTITPQQVLEVMEGNSAWVQQFEYQLERQFEQLASRVLDNWLENTDKEIRESLKTLAEEAISLFGGDTSSSSFVGDVNQVATGDNSNRKLENLVVSTANRFIDDLFTNSRTRVEESERSKEEATRYKQSRGQLQSELSQELSRGRRYE